MRQIKTKQILDILNYKVIIISICAIIIAMLLMNIVDNKTLKITIYSVIYLSFVIAMFIKCNYKILDIRMFYTIIYSVYIGISPIVNAVNRNVFYEEQYLIVLIGYILFFIGCSIKLPKKEKHIKQSKKDYDKGNKIIRIIAYIFLIVSIIASIIYITKNFDTLYGGDLENGRVTSLSSNGIIIQASKLSIFSLGILLEEYFNKRVSKKNIFFAVIITIFTASVTGYRNPLFIMIILVMFMINKHKEIDTRKIIILGVSIVLLFSIWGVIRSGNSQTSVISKIFVAFQNGAINLQQIINKVPDSIPYQYGYTYLINIIMLRPGPDLDFTLWLKDMLNISFDGGGLTPTIIGELYLNFSNIGVVLGMLIIGIFVNILNIKYNNSKGYFWISMLIATLVSMFGGGIANVEISLIVMMLCYCFVQIIQRNRIINELINKITRKDK